MFSYVSERLHDVLTKTKALYIQIKQAPFLIWLSKKIYIV